MTKRAEVTEAIAAEAPARESLGSLLDEIISAEAIGQQQRLTKAYVTVSGALLTSDDIQEVRERGEIRQFKKKSAWRKLGRHFRISWEIEKLEGKWWHDEASGAWQYDARAIVTAHAPWGQSAQDMGGCSTMESRFSYRDGKPNIVARQKAQHDCEATAVTRAINRAISDLIAGGEVSAEEVVGNGDAQQNGNGADRPARPEQIDEYRGLLADEHIKPKELEAALQQIEGGMTEIVAMQRIAQAREIITKRGGTPAAPFVAAETGSQAELGVE